MTPTLWKQMDSPNLCAERCVSHPRVVVHHHVTSATADTGLDSFTIPEVPLHSQPILMLRIVAGDSPCRITELHVISAARSTSQLRACRPAHAPSCLSRSTNLRESGALS